MCWGGLNHCSFLPITLFPYCSGSGWQDSWFRWRESSSLQLSEVGEQLPKKSAVATLFASTEQRETDVLPTLKRQ
uniref:Secreted protein n=1 Tax=Ixodes ricinus TaxID=34613 RepID=A0A6B0UB30_IXORI